MKSLFYNPIILHELRQSFLRQRWVPIVSGWIIVITTIGVLLYHTNRYMVLFLLPIVCQFLLAPVFAAGAFAKEYEQRTWLDLQITPITNLQLVTGKFLAIFLQMCLVTLSFTPLLSYCFIHSGLNGSYFELMIIVSYTLKIMISGVVVVLICMVCSRYSPNRLTATVVSFVAILIYGLFCAINYMLLNPLFTQAFGNITMPTSNNRIHFIFGQVNANMDGIYLLFSLVIGVGSIVLLWVSLSEQRGYANSGDNVRGSRFWQPETAKMEERSP